MYPHERSLVSQLTGKPFALIGVNSDKDRNIPRRLSEEGTVTWRSFWNGPLGTGGPIAQEWLVMGWPTIYLIDANGVIRYKDDRGQLRGEALNNAIEKLLAEMDQDVEIKHIDGGATAPGE